MIKNSRLQIVKTNNATKLLLISCFILLLAACFPVKDEAVNTDLFKHRKELEIKVTSLELGMTRYDAFKTLGIPLDRFSLMNVEELQDQLYSKAQVQGTPEQLEKFKNKLLSYTGYYIPFRSISKTGVLGLTKVNFKKQGYDLLLTLIFENNKLIHRSINGSPNIASDEDQYLLNSILKKFAGFKF